MVLARCREDVRLRLGEVEWNVRRDSIVAGDLALGVDVDFGEDDFAWFAFCVGQLLEDGRDDLAGPAPVGVEVDDGVG